MISRPTGAVTVGESTPLPVLTRARAGLVDDMERDDNRRGYERDETDAHRRLGAHLLRMVREADAQIPPERRARRTVQEMTGYTDRCYCGRSGTDCRCQQPQPSKAAAEILGEGPR